MWYDKNIFLFLFYATPQHSIMADVNLNSSDHENILEDQPREKKIIHKLYDS